MGRLAPAAGHAHRAQIDAEDGELLARRHAATNEARGTNDRIGTRGGGVGVLVIVMENPVRYPVVPLPLFSTASFQ